ncbi:Long-chain-fatty-acid--CoA ligase [Rhodococcus sp. IEGM 1330]|uniref:Long-chain-fatty-acid--CoA ligase n=1 Tax=Rhodococcus sp. IEGM 1330 TaxID=3082225 RepID=UPI002952C22F|nr:Long-chain-fatty-acid--CoA ligase [Rhodococcus sp. IEGM 1330]MDV8022660.1 Long-chain-fatty-acid--CoA ligase [Rhodococcus sp. IEGM 1330]
MTDPVQTYSLAQRPDLLSAFVSMNVDWPAFVEPSRMLVEWGIDAHRKHQLVTLSGETPVARAAALPISWDGNPVNLPIRGWDGIIEQSAIDTYTHARLNTLCALEVGIAAGHESQGLSRILLTALREHATRAGFDHLVVPVRPSSKTHHPSMPIKEYIDRRRTDGFLDDNWLRVHERVGGHIIGLCPTAMTITAPLLRWNEWTGKAFVHTGETIVEGGIAPVYVNIAHDYAVYVEPNVWIEHPLTNKTEKGTQL